MQQFIEELATIKNGQEAGVAIGVPWFGEQLLDAVAAPEKFIEASLEHGATDDILVGLACFLPMAQTLFQALHEKAPVQGDARSLQATAKMLEFAAGTILIRYQNIEAISQKQLDKVMGRIKECEADLNGIDREALQKRHEARVAAEAKLKMLLGELEAMKEIRGKAGDVLADLEIRIGRVQADIDGTHDKIANLKAETEEAKRQLAENDEAKKQLSKQLETIKSEAKRAKRALDTLDRTSDEAPKVEEARESLREAYCLYQKLVSPDSQLSRMMDRSR